MAKEPDFGRFLQSVAERDVDLLLMEELHVNPSFVSFVISFGGLSEDFRFDGAWHSLNDENGETDLLLRVSAPGERIGFLIENKISAPPQEDQDLRYHLRGQQSQEEGRFDRFVTVICGPQVYLNSLPANSAYQHRIPYEAIRDWFADQPGLRPQWRAAIIAEAIEQGRRGYTMKVHAGKTAFHYAYWLVIQERFPELIMARPGPKGPHSDWIGFRAASFPKGVTLNHKADQACMDLEFAQTPVAALNARRDDSWPAGLRVLTRGKSAALSLLVPRVDMSQPLADQIGAVETALETALKLAPLARILSI